MSYTLEATNSLGEQSHRFFKDWKSAIKAFEAVRFMCFGTNMTVYLYKDKILIDKWDLPKGTRHLS